jgi:hypothetical protein
MSAKRLAVFLAIGALALASTARAAVLLKLDNIGSDEILAAGFELPRAVEVQVEAVGLRRDGGELLAAYAWIIDSDSREAVWTMDTPGTSRRRGPEVEADETIRLGPGRYELYMAAVGGYWGNWDMSGKSFEDLGELFRAFGDLFKSKSKDRDRDFEADLAKCGVTISSTDIGPGDVKTFEAMGDIPGALLRYNRLGDDQYIRQGFKLSEPGSLRIYSVLEMPDRAAVDQGWIVDAKTGERVWEVTRRNTEPAGGGSKNRKVDEEIRLAAGEYILYFATDDSHSWESFNTNPPDDPMNWGITILPGKDFKRGSFATYEPSGRGEALVDLTRARDDDYLEQAFELKRQTGVHIVCVGEYSEGSDEFVDHGAIQDAATGDLVWEMEDRNTIYAGGGTKNRMFDGTVTLPAGKYIAFYTTDDSHAYRDWNTSPPYDQAAWGLAIYPGPGFQSGDLVKVSSGEAAHGSKVLVSLTRVRDDEERTGDFTLDRPVRVRIHAVGEGQDGDMYDYGWIEDARTGRTVWEMEYTRTRHAGGARKNRQFDGVISLDSGKYEVHYITDGSHAFNDWNADRPRNPMDWGITVSLAEDGS